MSERENRYQEAINQGHSAAWDQHWDEAATFYRQALAENPDDPKALTSLALALFELQDYDQSLRFYLQVAKKTPTDPMPLEKAATLYEILKKPNMGAEAAVRAAELYLKNGDVEKAIENWSRVLGMNPEHLVAHSRLAVVYERLGRIPPAVREYLHIASLMQHAGEEIKAVQVVNRALKISPNHGEAQKALAMLREKMPLPKPARPQGGTGPIQETQVPQLSMPPEDSSDALPPVEEADQKSLAALANLFFEQNVDEEDEPSASREGSLKAILDGVGPLFAKNVDKTQLMLHLGQAVECLTSGDNERAAVELKRATDIGLHHPAAHYRLGVLHLESDRLESAIRYFKRAMSHADYALSSRLLLAEIYQKKEQVKQASIAYLEALSLADTLAVPPEHADGLRQLYEPLIEAHGQTAREEQSTQLCKTISEMLNRPRWRQYLLGIRKELVPADDGPPVPIAEVLTEASSSQVVVAMSRVRLLVREGRQQAAFEEALFALQTAPTYLQLHIAIGDLLVAKDQIQPAIQKFNVISRAYSVRGETARAIDMLRRVIEMSPLDFETRNRLINQLIAGGQSREAVEELIRLAEVYYSLAELPEARKTYTRALQCAQETGLGENWRVRLMHRIADIDVQRLNWRQALIIFEQICSIRPDDLNANQRLIDLNFRLGERKQALAGMETFAQAMNAEGRLEDVVHFLEKLSIDWPKQAMIKCLLADQYRALGRTEEALKLLEVAGEIFLDSGDRQSAVGVIGKIMELNPRDADKYRQLLDSI